MDKWHCNITNKPKNLTVGETFSISCEGQNPVAFKTPQITLSEQKDSHRLHVLKSSQKNLKSLELQVVSYRTGAFENIPFIITDGKNSVLGEGLSFSVESVLSKNPEKPNPSFGPWKTPYPIWWVFLSGAAIASLLVGLLIFGKVFSKRKEFVRKIQKRRGDLPPSKQFVNSLRKLDLESPNYIVYLSRFFRTFLENLLFIPVVKQPPSVVLKVLKKYNPPIYKSHGKRIFALLIEMDKLKHKKPKESICLELKKNCFYLAFDLEERRLS